MGDHHHAQWRANGNCPVTGDTVPGNDLGGVGGAHPTNAPADGARAHQAFRAAQYQATDQQAGKTQCRDGGQPAGGEHEHAAQAAAGQSDHYGPLAALGVNDATGVRTTQQCRQVLDADHQTCDDRAVTQMVMYITGQYSQRDADIQIADKGKQNDGHHLQCDRQWTLCFRHGAKVLRVRG